MTPDTDPAGESDRDRDTAPVDPRLLEIMACPDCHGSVRQVDDGIRCEQCGRVYPVRGVPVMLVEESRSGG